MTSKLPALLNPNESAWDSSANGYQYGRLKFLLGIFTATIFVAAGLFYSGSGCGWGIEATFANPGPVNFGDCLYFSIVTITTLGYGDYHPIGWGRAVAALEVFVGAGLIGVAISEIVSQEQSRLTRRLVRSQMNREVQDFRKQLASILERFRSLDQRCLASGQHPVSDPEFAEILRNASGLCKSIARYWRHEAQYPDLGVVLPTRATGRLTGEILELLDAVDKASRGLTAVTAGEPNRISIRNISEAALRIARVVDATTQDEGLRNTAERIGNVVTLLRKQLRLRRHKPI